MRRTNLKRSASSAELCPPAGSSLAGGLRRLRCGGRKVVYGLCHVGNFRNHTTRQSCHIKKTDASKIRWSVLTGAERSRKIQQQRKSETKEILEGALIRRFATCAVF